MDRDTISEIIDGFGGLTAMSEATKIGITTIYQWRNRGSIPPWRHDAIKKAARRHKVALPESFLEKVRT